MSIAPQTKLYITWLVLTGFTLIAWAIGAHRGAGPVQPDAVVGLSAMAITLVKVRVIIREFMDVRHAPTRLKTITDVWLIVFIIAMIVAYFVAKA